MKPYINFEYLNKFSDQLNPENVGICYWTHFLLRDLIELRQSEHL